MSRVTRRGLNRASCLGALACAALWAPAVTLSQTPRIEPPAPVAARDAPIEALAAILARYTEQRRFFFADSTRMVLCDATITWRGRRLALSAAEYAYLLARVGTEKLWDCPVPAASPPVWPARYLALRSIEVTTTRGTLVGHLYRGAYLVVERADIVGTLDIRGTFEWDVPRIAVSRSRVR